MAVIRVSCEAFVMFLVLLLQQCSYSVVRCCVYRAAFCCSAAIVGILEDAGQYNTQQLNLALAKARLE